MGLLGWLVLFLLVVVPLWRIFVRTGRSGAWSLLVAIPAVGSALVALLWGYGQWSRERGGDLLPPSGQDR